MGFLIKLKKVLERILRPIVRQIFHEEYMSNIKIFGDPSKLTIASTAKLNNTFFNCNSGTIIIEDYVGIAHNAMIITGSHDFDKTGEDRELTVLQNRNIIIKRGAFIGSGAIVLGPCTIGENAVVGAGAVVNKDVPENVIVAGNPFKIIRILNNNNM